jgi:hypothetical protein
MLPKEWREAVIITLGIVNLIALGIVAILAFILPVTVESTEYMPLFIMLGVITVLLGTISVVHLIKK